MLSSVYFVRAEGTSFLKIGATDHLTTRLRELQRACKSFRLVLEGTVELSRSHVYHLEAWLHRQYTSCRVEAEKWGLPCPTEWFNIQTPVVTGEVLWEESCFADVELGYVR